MTQTTEAAAVNPYEADAVTEAHPLPHPLYHHHLYRPRPPLAAIRDRPPAIVVSARDVPSRTIEYSSR